LFRLGIIDWHDSLTVMCLDCLCRLYTISIDNQKLYWSCRQYSIDLFLSPVWYWLSWVYTDCVFCVLLTVVSVYCVFLLCTIDRREFELFVSSVYYWPSWVCTVSVHVACI